MSSPTNDDFGHGEESVTRHFRFPALAVAAAEFRSQQGRAMRGPIGCLFVLAGIALLSSFFLFFAVGGRAVLGGLGLIVFGFVLLRLGLGIVFAWVTAIGVGAATAGSLLLLGIKAAWAYWTVAGFFGLAGFLIARTGAKMWPGFLHARHEAAHTGCRIALFRPFHVGYSAQAKNLLLPLLRGYGQVFVVGDESFDRSGFDGIWSMDYKALPGLGGVHRYANDDWQSRVKEEIANIDVAVVDISVPSDNVVWEIKQCYDRLPSHRIIFVASAHVLPAGLPHDIEDRDFQAALGTHIKPILKGLQELGANPTARPLFLIYSTAVEGQMWLAGALFQAMSNIMALETGTLQSAR